MEPIKTGKVYLVGAGPGDSELLTVKAQRLIESAKVVVYDRLISDEIMEKIPVDAVKINVGKNSGDHPVPQEKINQILVDKAKEGFDVIRLKGGDSFLFGRGGEELELLVNNSIEFEVVPGITSPIAAAAYAGIPVTHRDFCSSLHIITGHKKKDMPLDLDYDALVKLNGTLVFMMSVTNAGEIAKGLMKGGMSVDMPCAVVENGTRANQRKFVSTLENIQADVQSNKVISPAIIIVGRVCSLSDQFDWFSRLPLKGRKILVTRPKKSSQRLFLKLKALGADVAQIPAIKTCAIGFEMPDLKGYTALIFTSKAGVEVFFDGLYKLGKDTRALHAAKIFAVGSETANALLCYGIKADFTPSIYSGEALANELTEKNIVTKSDKLLIIKAKISAPELTDILKNAEIPFNELTAYETSFEETDSINPNDYDLVTFTSASCIEGFTKAANNSDLSNITAICIGEQTTKKAKEQSMKAIVANEATITSMVEKIVSTLKDRRKL